MKNLSRPMRKLVTIRLSILHNVLVNLQTRTSATMARITVIE